MNLEKSKKYYLNNLKKFLKVSPSLKNEFNKLFFVSNLFELNNLNNKYINDFVFTDIKISNLILIIKYISFLVFCPFIFIFLFLIKIFILSPAIFIKNNNVNIKSYTIFFDIFTHYSFKDNTFESNYWGNFLKSKSKNKNDVIIFHLLFKVYSPIKFYTSLKTQKKISNSRVSHFMLESFLNFKSFFMIFIYGFYIYFKIIKFSMETLFLKEINKNFKKHILLLILNKLKPKKILNFLIYYFSFSELININKSSFKKSKKILYICENQPWESLLNYFTNNLTNNYGYAHIPFNSYDLRYLSLAVLKNFYSRIKPYRLLVVNYNSSINKENSKNFLFVNSLRFKFLDKFNLTCINNIYFFGDFSKKNNILLVKYIKFLENFRYRCFLKPHPTLFNETFKKYSRECNIVNTHLSNLKNNSIVLTTEKSSIVFDCLEYGIPVAILKFNNSINLYQEYKIPYINSYDELIDFIEYFDIDTYKNFMSTIKIFYNDGSKFWNNY